MKADHLERELQFATDDTEAVAAWLKAQPEYAAISIAARGEVLQDDTYLDTADWAVYRAAYSLRVRRKGLVAEATLKALHTGPETLRERREISQPLSIGAPDWQNAPGPVLDRVRLLSGGAALQSLFSIVTRRRSYVLYGDDTAQAELCLDESSVTLDGATRARLKRVEVEEQREGGLEAVRILIEAMKSDCELTPTVSSKFEAGLEACGLAPDAGLDFGFSELDQDATTGEYAYALLRRYLADFLRHEPGTRLGEDPEELHQMRVATRRLRAAMSTFQSVLPWRFQTFREGLKEVGRGLGEVRDLDVELEWLRGMLDKADWSEALSIGEIRRYLERQSLVAQGRLRAQLAATEHRGLIEAICAALRGGDAGQGDAALPIQVLGAAILKRRYGQFRRESRGLSPDEEPAKFHAVRRRSKRLRYTVEALEPVFGRPARRFAASVRDVQDLLGAIQDGRVATEALREMTLARVTWRPATLLMIGELVERRRREAKELRRAWPRSFDKTEGRWRRLRKRLKRAPPRRDPATAAASGTVRPPVQRPLSLLRPYLHG